MTMIGKRLLFILLLLLEGCGGCQRPLKPEPKKKALSEQADDDFFIDDKKLKNLEHFSYKANFALSFGQGDKLSESLESMEIVKDGKRMLLKKSIDGSHFFELMSDGESFLIKNQNNPWQVGASPQMYKKLFGDALNLTKWLLDQVALGNKNMDHDGQGRFEVRAQIPSDAPLLKKLAAYNGFKTIAGCRVAAKISMDQGLSLPVLAHFSIDVRGIEEHFFKIRADMAFNESKRELAWPEVSAGEAEAFPVNLSARFLQLMKPEGN